MSDYDIILEYTTSRDMLTQTTADSILEAINDAFDEAILYKDLRYIASIEVMPNNDKEKICKH